MHTREPNLQHILALGLGWYLAPQILHKICSSLIQSHSMAHGFHDLVLPRVLQMLRIPHPTDGTHGIPQPEEAYLDLAGESTAEAEIGAVIALVFVHIPSE